MKYLQQGRLVFAIVFLSAAFFPSRPLKAQSASDFEISKNIEIFTSLYKEINREYVDGIKPSEFMKTGIDAMLDDLDPYTVYIPESEIEDYRFMTTGEYGGIGSLIHRQGDFVIISEPYEGSPAQKAGLKAGDKILKVNDKDANGKSVEDVSAVLKGQPNTKVKLLVQRPGESGPRTFEIEREKISIDPVPYYGMLPNGYGYIKLTSFTQTASGDVRKALIDLKAKNNLKGLLLDLRDNGGGLLTEAVNIVNLFVKRGELVVTTKGRQADKNKSYSTTGEPIDANVPLAVLVNGNSASASEIVAGALQDLDRAVIVGRRTFGKGLVQNVFPLNYNTQVKVTVAKYYIPSGRCIQAIDYAHKNANGNPDYIPDSLITPYKTLHGRTVYDGKGIYPDIPADTLRLSPATVNLLTQFMIFDFATDYANQHPSIAPATEFALSDEDFKHFIQFVGDKKFEFNTASESELLTLKKIAQAENSWDEIKAQFEAMQQSLVQHKKNELTENQKEITELLEQEIISRYYFQKGRIQAVLKNDSNVSKAINVLSDQSVYTSILDGSRNPYETQAPKARN